MQVSGREEHILLTQDITRTGLSTAEVAILQEQYGKNVLQVRQIHPVWTSLGHVWQEPMFWLLAITGGLYFSLGEQAEGIMMAVSIVLVIFIEVFQETRSELAIKALDAYTASKTEVLRNGSWQWLPAAELVPGDILQLREGELMPADGRWLEAHDLCLNESVLTGESFPVDKTEGDEFWQGTTLVRGQGIARVSHTGIGTRLGQLGKSMREVRIPPTPLQRQINRFVRQMGVISFLVFAVVFLLNWLIVPDLIKALLFSLTIAMALIPEEIPVSFSVFMALGALRMSKQGILAKQPKTVESLGSATVICLDKTGTITRNQMALAVVTNVNPEVSAGAYGFWASELNPTDPMEQAIAVWCAANGLPDLREGAHLIGEYPLTGTPPMMAHVWQDNSGRVVVSGKGALERILAVCDVAEKVKQSLFKKQEELAGQGYRILGVARADWPLDEPLPTHQEAFSWQPVGLLAFYDPPREQAAGVFAQFHQAGIKVKMITGDHSGTALQIARLTGLSLDEAVLTGDEVMALSDQELPEKAQQTTIFARMFPEAKLRVVQALQSAGETVAMTGDGVNDGPALRAAEIGIAMGERGTEIARQAASLVLIEDDLESMVKAIRLGRRIYNNLRKAIRYIISIHLPIVLSVLVPLIFSWPYPHILLPLHVIFLEIIMDPTCAVVFENEPTEPHLMSQPPRDKFTALFSGRELGLAILTGMLAGGAVLGMYYWGVQEGLTEAGVRSLVLLTLLMVNLLLTITYRSMRYTIVHTIRYRNGYFPIVWGISLLLIGLIIYWPLIQPVFGTASLSATWVLRAAGAALLGVGWFEGYKGFVNWRISRH